MAITGACPGPLFAQTGSDFGVVIIIFLIAIAGTWVYGLLREITTLTISFNHLQIIIMQIKQFEDTNLAHYSYAILSDCEDTIVLVDPDRNP